VPPAGFQRFSAKRKLLALLPARLMVLVGLLAVIISWRCWKTPPRLFGLGALLWTVSVAGKIAFATVANDPVRTWLGTHWASSGDLVYWCYIGLLTGVFECGIFLLIARPLRRKEWKWQEACSVGIGFGGAEAIVLGVVGAVSYALRDASGVGLPAAFTLVGPVERLIALAVHAASTVMIIYALTRKKRGWFAAAFLYKSAIDAVAAFVALSAPNLMATRPWAVELCLFGPFAYVGVYVLFALRRRW